MGISFEARLVRELLLVLDPVRTALKDGDPFDAVLQLFADAFVDAELLFGREQLKEWHQGLDSAVPTLDRLSEDAFEVAQLPSTVAAIEKFIDAVTVISYAVATADLEIRPEEAVQRLIDHLVGVYLNNHQPALLAALSMLRVVSLPDWKNGRSMRLHLDRIGRWITDPAAIARDMIGWGTESFDPAGYVSAVADAVGFLEVASSVDVEQPSMLEPVLSFDEPLPFTTVAQLLLLATNEPALLRFGLRLQASPPSALGSDAGFALSFFGNVASGAEETADNSGHWLAHIALDGQVTGVPFISIRPAHIGLIKGEDSGWDGSLVARLRRPRTADPVGVVETPYLHLTLGHPAVVLTVRADDVAALSVSVATTDASLTLAAPEGDGFLASLIPRPVTQHFAIALGWDTTRGFYIGNGASLSMSIPLSFAPGAILTLETAHLSAAMPDALELGLTVDGTATLGPLTVTLQGIGLTGSIDLAEPLNVFQPDLGFLPPHGAGIQLATGPVSGGGFISRAESGQYLGALELQIGPVGLSAFGIVDTQVPGGGPGFSMIILITARFAPMPLGFGFTLNSVGGLLGVNRDVDVDALFAAVRSGTAQNILAPADPVRGAARLAQQVGAVFPVSRGQHVIGPTLQLGWGSPKEVISLDLGLAMTLPDPVRLILVGSLRAILPDQNLAIVRLNVDVAGILDISASRFDMEGRVHDSVIQSIPVTGGFAMRSSWGREKNFAFSIGGLHPGFEPPANFPQVDRMGVDLSRGAFFQFRLVGYFAITSNSLQLGARADLKVREAGLTLLADVSFDALFLFDPFEMDLQISAGGSIKRGSSTLCSIRMKGRLRGPGPWLVSGNVSIRILFLTVSIGFSKSFGSPSTTLAEAVDAGALIADAMAAPRSWLGQGATTGGIVIEGLGEALGPYSPLAVQQKVAPLGLRLDQVGGRRIAGARRFEILEVRIDGQLLPPGPPLLEAFAPAQFLAMADQERLTAPSFEEMPAGAVFAGDEVVKAGGQVVADTSAETIILDAPERVQLPAFRMRRAMKVRPQFITVSLASTPPKLPPTVSVLPESWVATDVELNVRSTGTYAQLRQDDPSAVLARASEVTR